jgi:hypothetical protein
MAARKTLDRSKLLWRIRALTVSPEREHALRQMLEAKAGVDRGITDWDALKREGGFLITGYQIVLGDRVADVIHWAPLRGVSQQLALNRAFDRMKQVNMEENS